MKQHSIYLNNNDKADLMKFFGNVSNDSIASSIHFSAWKTTDGESVRLYPYEIIHACALLKKAGLDGSRLYNILAYYLK